MKKLTILIILALITQTELSSQSCLPDGITFSTQAEIDSFQINYPNCTQIEGDVAIFDEYGIDINNLNGLDVLTDIGGNLIIGSLNHPNPLLTSLSGMNNITSIGGNLELVNNPYITNLAELGNLTFIGGGINLGNNIFLTNIWGLSNITSIGGDLIIQENALQNLGGLSNLQSINGKIVLRFSGVNNISGIENIDASTIEYLEISFNNHLSICDINSICDYLTNPNGGSFIYSNNSGCNSQLEIENACTVYVPNINTEPNCIIYPNPAKNEISIISMNGILINEVTVYNHLGQKVLHKIGITDRIDISILGQGIYFIELTSNDLKIREKLIIK